MIKAVATDIDGTFLTAARQYDQALFRRVYAAMAAQGVHFIVASGDQYYFLRALFPDQADQLGFVAENGALTVDHNRELHCARIDWEDVQVIDGYIATLPDTYYIICGRQQAYVKRQFAEDYLPIVRKFYQRFTVIDDLTEIDDTIFKFALGVPGAKTKAIAQAIDDRFLGVIRATASGYGALDLIVPGMDKSYGLKLLLQAYGIKPAELAVFGDGENDLEMFNLAGTSYAMGNAPKNVQAAANHVIGTNEDQAVLHELARLFM